MNFLIFMFTGLLLTLLLFTGCVSRSTKDAKNTLKSRAEAVLNVEKEQSQKQLNAMESKGRALIRKGELDEAVKVYNRLSQLSHYKGRGAVMNGLTLMLRDIHDYGDIPKCVEWCDGYIRKNKNEVNVFTASNMATLYGKSNRFEDAVDVLKPFYNDPLADVDYYHDYSTFNLDVAEHKELKGGERTVHLSSAREAVDIIGRRFGKNQRYWIALGEYYTVARDFDKAKEAYKNALNAKMPEGGSEEYFVQFSEANMFNMEIGVMNGNYEKGMEYVDNVFKAFDNIGPYCYDRFYVDRLFAFLVTEYYYGNKILESRQVAGLLEEHKQMEKEGFQQPRQLKVIHQEIYNYLVNREKGNYKEGARNLKRAIAYYKVTQACPIYHPVHLPVGVSMLYGLQGNAYVKAGDSEKARKAFREAINYNPKNTNAKTELEKINRLSLK